MFTVNDSLELPDDKFDAAVRIYQRFNSGMEYGDLDEANYASAFVFLLHFCRRNFPQFAIGIDDLVTDNIVGAVQQKFAAFEVWINSQKTLNAVEAADKRFGALFETDHFVEFSDSDLARIQGLINNLRDLIANSRCLETKHQARILRRLEKMQTELHKKVSDVDWFWGFLGDAGVTIRKFGEDCGPLVDCIKELANIIWKAQELSAGLPPGSGFPLITQAYQSHDDGAL